MRKTFEGAGEYFTVGQAIEGNKEGIYFEVNDGKDITIVIEKEPTTNQDD